MTRLSARFVLPPLLLVTACGNTAPGVTDDRATPTHADGQEAPLPDGITAETITDRLEHPWGIAFLPDGRALVTERPGRLRVVRPAGDVSEPVGGVPEVFAENQGGLLDIALDPAFAANDRIYLSYARRCPGGGATTAVTRAKLVDKGDGASLADAEDILVADACHPGGRHFAGRMVFDRDGYLYVAVGDRGIGEAADNAAVQDLRNHIGTVLRLTTDGAPAPGNPFADRKDADAAVFTYGHRNIQGMTLHPDSGAVWTHEHGPRGGDEVNILVAGTNYGWPEITYGEHYRGGEIGPEAAEGLAQPHLYWDPSIAPSGMAFVDGEAAIPEWRGDLLIGALAYQLLARLEWDGAPGTLVETERLLVNELGRIRSVTQAPDGAIVILTDAPNGKVVRLIRSG